MNEISFRRATQQDVVAIVAMLADDPLGAAREDVATPIAEAYVRAFQAIDADPNQYLAVATENGIVVGTLQLTFIPGLSRKGSLRGQIEAVRVAAGSRGAGLGQRLFGWAIEECRSRGCRTVQLTTDRSRADAHRFYERLGFEASHIGYKLAL
jgi:GNAT superfamily N-acetyltransferase